MSWDLPNLDEDEKAVDFVVVDMLKGPLSGCDWIRFKREKLSRRLKRKLQKKLEELLANKHNLLITIATLKGLLLCKYTNIETTLKLSLLLTIIGLMLPSS